MVVTMEAATMETRMETEMVTFHVLRTQIMCY